VYPPVTFNASIKQRFNAVPHDDPIAGNDSNWFAELSAFGWLPKDGIPGFVRKHAVEQGQPDLTTDRPLMLTMSECPIALTQQQTLIDNATVAAFMTRGNYLQLSAMRTIQVGAAPSFPVYNQISAVSRTNTVTASAPVAKSVMIEGLPLSDSPPDFSQTITTATRRTVDLTWTAETGSGIVAADEWEVTLIPIPGNKPWRVYHVTAPLVHVDTADLTTGVPNSAKNFLVKIVSHVGVPEAKTGNYTKVEYPYAATTTIPYGFKIP
jgi:hypothetical protein